MYIDFNPRTPLQSATAPGASLVVPEAISIHALHYRVRPQHIVVYSAILLVAAKNFCAIQVQRLIVRRFIAFVGANLPGKVCLLYVRTNVFTKKGRWYYAYLPSLRSHYYFFSV